MAAADRVWSFFNKFLRDHACGIPLQAKSLPDLREVHLYGLGRGYGRSNYACDCLPEYLRRYFCSLATEGSMNP